MDSETSRFAGEARVIEGHENPGTLNPLHTVQRIDVHDRQKVFELQDSTTHRLEASFLVGSVQGRFPERQSGLLAEQFIEANRSTFEAFEIDIHPHYDGRQLDLAIETHRQVGAIPLQSPTTGDPDYGLVVKPRFGWAGIGPTLARTGWRVTPTILERSALPKSDREIPPWVLSSVVLPKLRSLLHDVHPAFEMVERDRRAPRGQVDWKAYATEHIPKGRMLDVPCRHPDLTDDRDLLGAIHHALRRHRSSLQTQLGVGPFVQHLLSVCEHLLQEVRHVAPRPPERRELDRWRRRDWGGSETEEGLRALQWTVESRGLAGLGELQGLPWQLSMEDFFEAWVERIVEVLSREHGGSVRTGRERETVVPLQWEPPYAGSQRALIPDVVWERPDHTVVIDAKYKRHVEDLEGQSWHAVADRVRDTHRDDLLQVLAYANLAEREAVTACLVYPFTYDDWTDLRRRSRVTHRAEFGTVDRRLSLVLAAVPIGGDPEEVAGGLAQSGFV